MALGDPSIWHPPTHHHDLDDAPDHVHWTELFYDLIHVVTIFLLGNYLTGHMGWAGFLVFAGLFVALWYAWGELSIFNSIFISPDMWHRLFMSVMVCTVMVMAASIPTISSGGWTYFAAAFAMNRFIIGLLYWRAGRFSKKDQTFCNLQGRNFFIFGVIFLATAVLPDPISYYAFGLAMIATQCVYMIPKISVLWFDRFRPRMAHMSERFALMILIVLGEGFFKLVVTLSDIGIEAASPDILVNFLFGGVSLFVMAWIYFDFAGRNQPKDQRAGTLIIWWLSHLVLMICAVTVGVALTAEVKMGWWEYFPTSYAAMGCFGLTGYIAMLWLMRLIINSRSEADFAHGSIRLFGIIVAVACFFLSPYTPTYIGNLAWGTALFSQIIIPGTKSWTQFHISDVERRR